MGRRRPPSLLAVWSHVRKGRLVFVNEGESVDHWGRPCGFEPCRKGATYVAEYGDGVVFACVDCALSSADHGFGDIFWALWSEPAKRILSRAKLLRAAAS